MIIGRLFRNVWGKPHTSLTNISPAYLCGHRKLYLLCGVCTKCNVLVYYTINNHSNHTRHGRQRGERLWYIHIYQNIFYFRGKGKLVISNHREIGIRVIKWRKKVASLFQLKKTCYLNLSIRHLAMGNDSHLTLIYL